MEEVSIVDKDLANKSTDDEDDPQGQVFYDASDELEDFNEREPIIVQLRNRKEAFIPQEPTELQKQRRRQRQTQTKGQRYAPEFHGKQHFLRSS